MDIIHVALAVQVMIDSVLIYYIIRLGKQKDYLHSTVNTLLGILHSGCKVSRDTCSQLQQRIFHYTDLFKDGDLPGQSKASDKSAKGGSNDFNPFS